MVENFNYLCVGEYSKLGIILLKIKSHVETKYFGVGNDEFIISPEEQTQIIPC
jgi:hypothetical protein